MTNPQKTAFVFPGQGSQFVGMGADLAAQSPAAADLFSRAGGILGRDLLKIMTDGPEDELKRTENTQPAVLALSAALLGELDALGVKPDVVAGHSLGEYTALFAAGVLTFDEVLGLVKLRSEQMGRAGDIRPGGMAAVMGLDDDKLAEICAATAGVVVVANYNAPGQTVISGETAAVAAACEACKAAGAKRALPLPVSGAFHSPLMEEPNRALVAAIAGLEFRDATAPVVCNVDGAAHSSGAEIRARLGPQMVSGVQWTRSVETLVAMGVTRYVEIGPGKVLAGLIKRIAKDAEVLNVVSLEDVRAIRA